MAIAPAVDQLMRFVVMFRNQVGGGAFNLLNNGTLRDIQDDSDNRLFGGFLTSAWREYKGKFALEFRQ